MGRRHLLTLALGLLAAGCGAPELQFARADDDPHREVACATCHAGALADAEVASVPAATCASAGCHEDQGPRQVRLGSVEFLHRGHAGDSVVAMQCAGCHLHSAGDEPLVAGVEACSLCHLSEQSAGLAGECRTCHVQPSHVAMASQGVEIPHRGLPWIEGGCVRCHYDVTEAPVDVSLSQCAACHADMDQAVALGIGEDLHGAHTGVGCVSCHEEGTHQIRAMTSAVALECVDCHTVEHDVALTTAFPDPATCNDCHSGVHAAQQRLTLGLVEGLPSPQPSEKFMDGLSCRSCHVASAAASPAPTATGVAAACVDCHRAEYAEILAWWRQGGQARLARVAPFVEGGLPAVDARPADDSLRVALAEARAWVALVREGGAVHNLPLAHQLLQSAADRVAAAYRATGTPMPPPPDLGRQPSMGLCTYCHYRADDPWLFREMSGPFHREVLGIR